MTDRKHQHSGWSINFLQQWRCFITNHVCFGPSGVFWWSKLLHHQTISLLLWRPAAPRSWSLRMVLSFHFPSMTKSWTMQQLKHSVFLLKKNRCRGRRGSTPRAQYALILGLVQRLWKFFGRSALGPCEILFIPKEENESIKIKQEIMLTDPVAPFFKSHESSFFERMTLLHKQR